MKQSLTSDPYNLHYLSHRVKLDGPNQWQYDAIDWSVRAVVRVAAGELLNLRIPVCSPKAPMNGRYPIRRVQGGLWYIAPAIYTEGNRKIWLSSLKDFAPALHSTFLALTNTPEYVEAYLDQLEIEVACGF